MNTNNNGGLTKEVKDLNPPRKKLAMFCSLIIGIFLDYKKSRSCRVFLQSRSPDFEAIRAHPKATL